MKNAPLIEIVAEIRWGEGISTKPPALVIGGDETLYVRLGIGLGKGGYERLERVQPEGIPSLPGAVVYRYRRADELQNTLYQAGLGVFTANGLPPYNSWEEFSPVVAEGIRALWEARAFEPSQTPIELILRYVDAFTSSHLGEMSQANFIDEVVGVKYQEVPSIKGMAEGAKLESVRFNAVHSAATGERLVIEVGQGSKDGEEVLVLNTAAFSSEFVATSVDEVSTRFNELQDLLHKIFFEMLDRLPELRKSWEERIQ